MRQVRPTSVLAAEIALRQFKQQRSDGFLNIFEVIKRHQQPGITNKQGVKAVQQLIPLMLACLDVAHRVVGDGRDMLPVTPDAERNLLGHRAGRQEDSCLSAQYLGDLALEILDQRPRAVGIRLLIGTRLRDEFSKDLVRACGAVTAERPLALRENRILCRSRLISVHRRFLLIISCARALRYAHHTAFMAIARTNRRWLRCIDTIRKEVLR